MGKLSEDYEKDPKYWTQFYETIDSLHIEKVVLANHKTEEDRIKDLLLDAAGRIHEGLWEGPWECNNALIQFSWYQVYHFFKFGYSVNLEYFETDTIEELYQKCSNNYDGELNLCIIEYKKNSNILLKALEPIWKKVKVIAVVYNKDLHRNYRFNYIYRN